MRFANLKFINTTVPKGVQARVDFGKYELSIVKNDASYGNKQGKYEIAVFEGDDQVELPGITEPGDTVKGYLTEKQVDGIMLKMVFVTRNDGKNLEEIND